jgi:hypothetical protein
LLVLIVAAVAKNVGEFVDDVEDEFVVAVVAVVVDEVVRTILMAVGTEEVEADMAVEVTATETC